MHQTLIQGLNTLQHSIMCKDNPCEFHKCGNMKCLLNHLKECQEKHQANCVVCKEMLALICQHAKNCGKSSCKIPYCQIIKDNILVCDDWRSLPPSPVRVKGEYLAAHPSDTIHPGPPSPKRLRWSSPVNVKNEFYDFFKEPLPYPPLPPVQNFNFQHQFMLLPNFQQFQGQNNINFAAQPSPSVFEGPVNFTGFDPCQPSTSAYQNTNLHDPLKLNTQLPFGNRANSIYAAIRTPKNATG